MKKFLVVLFLLFASAQTQAVSIDLGAGASSDQETPTNVLNEWIKYGEIQGLIESKEIERKSLADSTETSQKEIENLEIKIAALKTKIQKNESDLDQTAQENEAARSNLLRILQNYYDDLVPLENALKTETEKRDKFEAQRQAKINKIESEISLLEEELSTQRFRLTNTFSSFFKRFLVLAFIIFGLKFIQRILPKILENISMTQARRKSLLFLNRIVINIMIVITVLVVFFSQLLSILPYLAIFLTVITLALKDVILSFIGWFVIGLKEGFRVGDYIRWGQHLGTVIEITPVNTVLRQGGMSGPTGKLITIPNKKIFLEDLENWSRWNNYTFVDFEYFFEPTITPEAVEEKLKNIIKSFESQDVPPSTIKRIGADQFEARTFWQITRMGFRLQGKVLIHFDHYLAVPSEVNRAFIKSLSATEKKAMIFTQSFLGE